jgi:2,3-diaminopropionate biosynthesis protein SbnB
MSTRTVPSFATVSGGQVRSVLTGRERGLIGVVRSAYELHGAGRTVNPDSYFLRFPDRPQDRIIALPASVDGVDGGHGMKWISSFPENVAAGIPRASAVLILNDAVTGYPYACLEASIISASRTAASAALAAGELARRSGRAPRRLGIVGTGLIGRYTHAFLSAEGFAFDEIGLFDLSAERAGRFGALLGHDAPVRLHGSLEQLIRESDLIVFTTTAGTPYVHDPAWFAHHPIVLHLSLRDLAPDVVLAGWNLTDDVEHSMKANTSLHLTEQQTGHRGFVAGDLPALLAGRIEPVTDRSLIFSPFGLGVLDLMVGRYVYQVLADEGRLDVVDEFFVDTTV